MLDFNKYPDTKPANKAGKGQILCVCECPQWNAVGFQVALHSQKNKIFDYPDSPNGDFDKNVTGWVILEA